MSFRDFVRSRLNEKGKSARKSSLETTSNDDFLRGLIRADKGFNPTLSTLCKVAEALDLPLGEVLAEALRDIVPAEKLEKTVLSLGTAGASPTAPEPAQRADPSPPAKSHGSIPVLGTAAGAIVAESHGFEIEPEPIEHVPAPPGLAETTGLYGLYVVGDSMSPAINQGDLQIVHRKRPPRLGDIVVVRTKHFADDPGQCYIKKLVKIDADYFHLEQYSPRATTKMKRQYVAYVHRVLSMNEIFGV